MAQKVRPLAVVTGASTGIGYELAKCCARHGFDLTIAADEPKIVDVAKELGALGVSVTPIEADLATFAGVDRLYSAIGSRPVEALLANAGRGLGGSFLDQEFEDLIPTSLARFTWSIRSVSRCGRAAKGAS